VRAQRLILVGGTSGKLAPGEDTRFDRLVGSLEEVREHVSSGRFDGRMTEVAVGADDIRAVRERSGSLRPNSPPRSALASARCRNGSAASAGAAVARSLSSYRIRPSEALGGHVGDSARFPDGAVAVADIGKAKASSSK
jgi:hypothetical protein